MFYYNKVCDGCSEQLLEGEDIVVCPECGTPQHRECYKKNNECVNAHLHAEGFDWRAANPEPEKKENDVEKPLENEAEAPVRESRTADFSSPEEIPDIPFPEVPFEGVYLNGQTFGANEDVGGATVSEVVTYTQINSRHYLKKLIKNKHKKSFFLSWNWGACLFGPAWFFYRKLYKAGAVLLALAISATLAITPFVPTINEYLEKVSPMYNQMWTDYVNGVKENPEEAEEKFNQTSEEIYSELLEVLPQTIAVLFATYGVSHIIPALIANFFYRKKMLEDIKFAKEATSDRKVLRFSLIRRGGVSLFAGLAASFATNYLPSIIMTVVSYFTN